MSRDLEELIRYTLIWTFVLVWLGLGIAYTTPPAGPYSDLILTGFKVMLAVVLPAVSLFLVVSWVVVFRERRR